MNDFLDMDEEEVWELMTSDEPVEEFMSNLANDTVDDTVDFFMDDDEFFAGFNDETLDHIRTQLIKFIIKSAIYWAERKEKSFKYSLKAIMDSQIPLTSLFDDSANDDDFRILRTKYYDNSGNKISEIYDLQCHTKRIEYERPYWESIVRDLDKNQYLIKKFINKSRAFSIRINREESETETNKKINNLILKIKNYKH